MCNSIRFFFFVATLGVAIAQNTTDAAARARARAAELRSAATSASAATPATTTPTPAPAPAVGSPAPAVAPAIDENQIRRIMARETEGFATKRGLERVNDRLISVEGKIMTMTAVFITAIVIIILALLFLFFFRRSTPPPPPPDSDEDGETNTPRTDDPPVHHTATHAAIALLVIGVSGLSAQTPSYPTAADVADALSLSADAADGVKALRGQVAALRGVVAALCGFDAAMANDAFGPRRGSSSQRGTECRKALIDTAVGDPRIARAVAEGIEAGLRKLPSPTTPATGGLSEVNVRIDRLEADRDALGRRIDAVAATANEAKTDAAAASAAAFSAQQTATELRQLLARKGSRGIKNALKTPPPATAAPAPPERKKGPAFTKAEK